MKKTFILFSSLSILGLLLFACSKANRSKLSQSWKVAEYVSETVDKGEFSESYKLEKGDDKNITYTSFSSNEEDTTYTYGTLAEHTWTINKDGSFEYTNYSWTTYPTDSYDTITEIHELNRTGLWTFVGKNKTSGFAKNERILFTILKEKVRKVKKRRIYLDNIFVDSTYSDNTDNYQYEASDFVMTFTVVESKKDLLKLSTDTGNETNEMDGQSTNSYQYNATYTLKK